MNEDGIIVMKFDLPKLHFFSFVVTFLLTSLGNVVLLGLGLVMNSWALGRKWVLGILLDVSKYII